MHVPVRRRGAAREKEMGQTACVCPRGFRPGSFPHATGADGADDFVGSELVSGGKLHANWRFFDSVAPDGGRMLSALRVSLRGSYK